MYAAFHITAQHSHYAPIEDFGTVVQSAIQRGHYIMFLCYTAQTQKCLPELSLFPPINKREECMYSLCCMCQPSNCH